MYRGGNSGIAEDESRRDSSRHWKRALSGVQPQQCYENDAEWAHLPLHNKRVPRIEWEQIDALMATAENEIREAYGDAKRKIMDIVCLSQITMTRPFKARITDSDFDELLTEKMICRTPGEPRGYVQIKTIPEKLGPETMQPTRRRWLAIPWDHNEHHDEVAYARLCTTQDIRKGLQYEGASTSDFAVRYT